MMNRSLLRGTGSSTPTAVSQRRRPLTFVYKQADVAEPYEDFPAALRRQTEPRYLFDRPQPGTPRSPSPV
jgi:hypothetical protein